jgi:hypothetical protein
MRRLWVLVGGAALLLDALILTGRILGPIDTYREASVHDLSRVIALLFGPFEAVVVLAAVLLLSWVVVAGERSRLLTGLLRFGVFLGLVLTAAGLYAAIDPPPTGASRGFATGSLSTTGRFAVTLPAVGVAMIAALATLIGVRALLQSRSTIVPVRGTTGA